MKPIFLYGFKHLFHSIAHQIGSPPPSDSRSSPLHMWSTHKFNDDTPYAVFSWRGNYNFSLCWLRCLCFHCQRCWLSCLSWIYTCFFNAFTLALIFATMHWHCVIHKWGSHSSQCHHCQSHLNIFNLESCHFGHGPCKGHVLL